MGKRHWNFQRRDFIRAGIFGGVALSLRPGRLFSSIGDSSGPEKNKWLSVEGKASPRVYDVIRKYGAEFGAIKPSMRRP